MLENEWTKGDFDDVKDLLYELKAKLKYKLYIFAIGNIVYWVLSFVLACVVAMQEVWDNFAFTSDVVSGAMIGTFHSLLMLTTCCSCLWMLYMKVLDE